MFLDLFIIIKNPFKSANQRRKDFTTSCIVVGSILLFYNYYVVDNHTLWPNKDEYTFNGNYTPEHW